MVLKHLSDIIQLCTISDRQNAAVASADAAASGKPDGDGKVQPAAAETVNPPETDSKAAQPGAAPDTADTENNKAPEQKDED